ncbi:MAG: MFS transporter [Thermoflexales bacterium]|nr:MFS transporter [Thermoflexales bacterium]
MKSGYSVARTAIIGLGIFGNTALWAVYNQYVPVFLQQKFALPVAAIGLIMTLDNLAALFIQPLVGAWSDRTRTRIGRRMPYILIGAPIAALCFALVPLQTELPLFMLALIGTLLAMVTFRTPTASIMPDVTPSAYRSQANGILNLLGGIGGIVAFFVAGALYKQNAALPFWLVAGLMVAAMLLIFLFVREPRVPPPSEAEASASPWASLTEVFRDPEKSGLRLLLALFAWFLAFSAIEAMFSLYALNRLGIPESESALQLGLLSVMFALIAVPAGSLGARIGRRRTISLGIAILALMTALVFVLPPVTLATELANIGIGKLRVLSLPMLVMGVGWGLININSLPMVVDLTDNRKIGAYTGLYYLFQMAASVAGPITAGALIQASGNDYNLTLLFSTVALIASLALMQTVRRGEAQPA